ncbi:MAG: helix-turn-helix transcriptional regulator [Acidimicrobiales bacterium]
MSPDAGVVLAHAETEVERSTTATKATANDDFFKRTCTCHECRFANLSNSKYRFTISCDCGTRFRTRIVLSAATRLLAVVAPFARDDVQSIHYSARTSTRRPGVVVTTNYRLRVTSEHQRAASTTSRAARREREVVRGIARGRSNAEIAEELRMSAAAAKTHVSRVLAKLGACDRARLVVIVYETVLALLA